MSNPLYWNYYHMKRTLIFLTASSMIFMVVEAFHETESQYDTIREHWDSMAFFQTVNPCEDFFNYSCANWTLRHKIPDGKDDVSVIHDIEKRLPDDLLVILKESLTETDADHVKMIKRTYRSCMDKESIIGVGYKPVHTVLKYLFKSMGEWEEKNYDWIDTISKIRKLGYDHNFPLMVNVFWNRIEIGSPVIKIQELPGGSFVFKYSTKKFDIMNSTRARTNKQLMRKITTRPSVIEDWARNITYFETILSAFTWSTLLPHTMEIQMRTCLYDGLTPPPGKRLTLYQIYDNVRTCAINVTNGDKLRWFTSEKIYRPYVPNAIELYLQKIENDLKNQEILRNSSRNRRTNVPNTYGNTIKHQQGKGSEKAHRYSRSDRTNVIYKYEYTIKELQDIAPEINWLNYMKALFNDSIHENETLLIPEINPIRYVAKFMNEVPKVDIATYILWHVLMDYDTTVKELTRSKKNRSMECLGYIEKYMDIALSSYYIQRHNKKEDKEKALEIANYIKNEFVNIFESQDWMPKRLREKLKKRAMSIKVLVGYPDELLDDVLISNLYKTVNSTGYFVDIYKEMKKLDTDKKFSEIRERNNEWKQFSKVTDVRTHYDSSQNTIYIPAAILQKPYFDKERPWHINFGLLGNVIGREIAYRFILKGSRLGKNLKPRWGTLIDQKYKESVRCITDQYKKFAEENGLEFTNLTNTDLDVADIIGLQITHKAYISWVKDHGEEKEVRELAANPNQMIWIGAARGLCGKNRQKTVRKERKRKRYQSQWNFRVFNTIRNQPEFDKDFKCAVGTKMNPENKCQFL